MIVDKIRVGYSPLSEQLFIYRYGKDREVALEKREATGEIMAVIIQYIGINQILPFSFGDDRYEITVKQMKRRKKPKVDGA